MKKRIKIKKAEKIWNIVTYVVLILSTVIFGTIQLLNYEYIGALQVAQLLILFVVCINGSLIARVITTIVITIFFEIDDEKKD